MVARRILPASRSIRSSFARDIPAAVAKSMSRSILNAYAKCLAERFVHSLYHMVTCIVMFDLARRYRMPGIHKLQNLL